MLCSSLMCWEARQWGLCMMSVATFRATSWMASNVKEAASTWLDLKSQPTADVLSPNDKIHWLSSLGTRHSSQMLMAIPMNSNRLLNRPSPRKGQR
jgi:hypothetical protein